MRMRLTPLAAAVLVVSLPALAGGGRGGSIRRQLAEAGDRVEGALDRVRSSPAPACRATVDQALAQILDSVDALSPNDDPSKFDQVVSQLSAVQNMARASGCSDDVTRELNRSAGDLSDAASDVRRRRPPPNPGPVPPPPPGLPPVAFATPQVTETSNGPMLVISSITLTGLAGQNLYLAWHWRQENGPWAAWESLPQFMVGAGVQSVWPNPHRPAVPYTSLRVADPQGTGRFFAHVGLFDLNGRELNGIDVPFTVRYPNTAAPPPPVPPGRMLPPGPMQPPPPPGGAGQGVRDCGLGIDDPGCNATRGGAQAMLRAEWEGFFSSLRAQLSESNRVAMIRDTLSTRWITARQLGQMLDLFVGENNRLDAARFALPHVIDPSNALGYSAKFLSSSRQREFNQLVSSQN